jgi:predicted DNA-binding protein (UPF0251 family)
MLCEPLPVGDTSPEILRMVNSGKTSAAEAARLFGLHRSSVLRLMSKARAEQATVVG